MVNACKKVGFNIFINTGSNSEYGFKNKPMKESDLLVPNSHYSVFKSAATLFCQYEALSEELPIVTLRPFHVYGPYEEQTRFIPALISNLLIHNQCPPLVAPETARDMVYIDDAIDLYLLIASKSGNISGEIFNVGTDTPVTVNDLAEEVCKLFNVEKKTIHFEERKEVKHAFSDHSKLRKYFGYQIRNSLSEGLDKMSKWVKEVGVRQSNDFKNIEIEKNLPKSWLT